MPLLFAATLFVSACLLFLVQPMVGKLLLPLLGGTPAVWNTCLVFFQAALLAGYTYAHAATAWLGIRRQALLHLLLLPLPLLVLPVAVNAAAAEAVSGADNPVPWLLCTLAGMVGLPFFVVATTAPLLQRWFASTGHPSARDPYFLYAASNLGSLLGLLGYPLFVEPCFALSRQAELWAWGYGLFMGLVGLCALGVMGKTGPSPPVATGGLSGALTLIQRLRWVLLAFIPSSLMLGVTTYISTDVAAMPLLWVVPLALYLLSFVLVFARRQLVPHRLTTTMLPVLVLFLAVALILEATQPILVLLPLHLATFFVAAMACHGELARARPAAEYLTEFYLWMSVGGVLGGLFNGLIAPLAFRWLGVVEYPLALVLACAVLPESKRTEAAPFGRADWLAPLGLGLVAAALILAVGALGYLTNRVAVGVLFGALAMLAYPLTYRPRRFALGLAALMLASTLYPGPHGRDLFRERDFFGPVRVTREPATGWHRLVHGNTVHGKQIWHGDTPDPTPSSYYYPTGPAGQVCQAVGERPGPPAVAVCGLGAGALAAYARPGQRWTFFEIDPIMRRVAEDPRLFTFLRDGFPDPSLLTIDLGDARLRLDRDANDGAYGLIVIDVFSSDAVPVHLIDREALHLYLRKLAPGGLMLFHVSNRYLDLRPVLAHLALDAGLLVRSAEDLLPLPFEAAAGKDPSHWVLMTRRTADLGALEKSARWLPVAPPPPGARLWTDDYSNLLSVFRWLP